MTSDRSIRLAAFDTLDSAYIALGMLEANAIKCSLLNDVISSVYPLEWADPVLIVAPKQAEEARRLMQLGGLDKFLL